MKESENYHDYWETSDFLYAEYNQSRIYADFCKIIKHCGAFFYKNNTLIIFIKADIESVNAIKGGEGIQHYYIKAKELSGALYLMKKEEQNSAPIHDKVIRKDNDIAWKLTMLFTKVENADEEFKEEIEREFIWDVVESIEDCVLKIKKGKLEEFVLSENVTTLEDIKEAARFLKNSEK